MKWLKAAGVVSIFYGIALLLLFGLRISGTPALILGGLMSVPGLLIALPFGGFHSGMAVIAGAVVNWCLYVLLARYLIRER